MNKLTAIGAEFKAEIDRLNALNVRQKADRHKIADALCAMAELHGATVDRRNEADGYPGPRRIYMSFTLDGAEAHIGLDGDSRSGMPIISWCARGGPGRCFGGTFHACSGAGWQSPPHHKATSCPTTVADLVNDLDGGLMSIAGGSAFQHYIHPWAAETAWIGAGSPTDRPKAEWLEEYRRTGVRPSESPAVAAARAAYDAAGGDCGGAVARAAADVAYRSVSAAA